MNYAWLIDSKVTAGICTVPLVQLNIFLNKESKTKQHTDVFICKYRSVDDFTFVKHTTLYIFMMVGMFRSQNNGHYTKKHCSLMLY